MSTQYKAVQDLGSRRRSSAFQHVQIKAGLGLLSEENDDEYRQAVSRRSLRPPTPRSYRHLRASAYIGWTISLLLTGYILFFDTSMASQLPGDVSDLPLVRQANAGLADLGRAAKGGRPAEEGLVFAEPKGGIVSKVTIVSGFYRIDSGKKHRVSEYHEWLTTFLSSVDLPIVFYCSPSQRTYIEGLRGSKPITIISNYETPFDMPPVANLGGMEWAVAQHRIDPEKHVHVPDVYGIWTAKPWLVKNAKDVDPYLSEYFFWVDAGGFREPSIKHTFSGLASRLDDIYAHVPADTLVLASTEVPFEPGLDYVKNVKMTGDMDRLDRLQGGWYGGKKQGIDWWERETMKVTRLQCGLQRFAAKEQPVWTQAARLNWPKIYVQNMAWREGPDCGSDMWFGFEYFADGRDCRVPAWNGPLYAKQEKQVARQWQNGTARWVVRR